MFNGVQYLGSELPRTYLPTLISIQFTLPVLLLALVGIVLILTRKGKYIVDWQRISIIAAWFFIPLFMAVIVNPTMYDNFRQFLFITPPLFVFAAIGFETLSRLIRPKWGQSTFFIALIVPGIIAGMWLHPFEYVYYNGLVGWTGNIGRTFENDYWGTSLCQAGKEVSNIAPEGSKLSFTNYDMAEIFRGCAKTGYKIYTEEVSVSKNNPDYSIILTRNNDDNKYFKNMKTIMTIGRGNTTFVVIKGK